jgi:hypothetical protein
VTIGRSPIVIILSTAPSTGGPCLPDDVRLFADDFYAKQGIGLTRVLCRRHLIRSAICRWCSDKKL